jgi:hypothetical protein
MIKIAISPSRVRGDCQTLPLGGVGFENAVNEKGERLIWLEPRVVARLGYLRGAGEGWSDVILRLAKETTPTKQAKQ